jgi:hypothetical protein
MGPARDRRGHSGDRWRRSRLNRRSAERNPVGKHLGRTHRVAGLPLPPGPEQSVVVRFEPIDDDGLAALVVEAPDRPGILLTIALELFQQGAQIARSLVRTSDGRAFNRFEVVEFSGAPLTDERREQIRNAVFAALALTEPSLRSP